MNEPAQHAQIPPKADLTVASNEFPLLAEAALAFIDMAHSLLGHPRPDVYDKCLTALQRVRPLLERFTEPCRKLGTISPIAVLDQLAKKQLPNVASLVGLAHVCAASAFVLLQALTLALVVQRQRQQAQPQESVKIDPEKLRKMN